VGERNRAVRLLKAQVWGIEDREHGSGESEREPGPVGASEPQNKGGASSCSTCADGEIPPSAAAAGLVQQPTPMADPVRVEFPMRVFTDLALLRSMLIDARFILAPEDGGSGGNNSDSSEGSDEGGRELPGFQRWGSGRAWVDDREEEAVACNVIRWSTLHFKVCYPLCFLRTGVY
jgi:hypothetical protein